MSALPLESRPADFKALFPASDRCFWELVQASTLRLQNADRGEATRLARSVTEHEPGAAEGWLSLGSLIYRGLLDSPESSNPDRMTEAEACFRKGLALAPGNPRGTFQLAQLQTNAGEHREALDLLLQALFRIGMKRKDLAAVV